MFEPGQQVLDVEKPSLPFTVTIDSLGFRGADFPRRKPAGQLRVLMIGDSQVYGDFVQDNETFPYQLQERLRSACRDVLVINAGVGGTTITDQAFVLQRTLPLSPDIVILVYVENDFDDLASPQSEWQRLAENRARKSRFPLSILYPIVRHTAWWNLGLKVVGTRALAREREVLKQAASPGGAGAPMRLRQRYGEALMAFRDTLTARGIPFVFAMFPSWLSLPSPSENLTWMAQFAQTHGISSANLLPALQATHLPATKLFLVPKDGHPSPLGYSIAVDNLAARILNSPVIPPACRR